MGLAERRALKDFQDNHFPGLKQKVTDAAGFDVGIEVAWDKLVQDDMGHLYNDAWAKIYFEPLAEALKKITVDDMGKDALKAGLKKVVITNSTGVYYGDRWAKLEGGVLTLDHEPTTNVDNQTERVDGLVSVLEKAL